MKDETTRYHYADCPHADVCARDDCYWRCMDAPENQPTKSDTADNLQRVIDTSYYLALARHYQNQGTCDCGKTTAYNCFVGADCPIAKALGESAAWEPYHE